MTECGNKTYYPIVHFGWCENMNNNNWQFAWNKRLQMYAKFPNGATWKNIRKPLSNITFRKERPLTIELGFHRAWRSKIRRIRQQSTVWLNMLRSLLVDNRILLKKPGITGSVALKKEPKQNRINWFCRAITLVHLHYQWTPFLASVPGSPGQVAVPDLRGTTRINGYHLSSR